ncbi:MAG TPA: 2-oxoacid:ferredoxin oxidoreductase subunit beta [Abditibacteriaceae bacterium]|nr:2-oxoacid:ferredoxin oxidoreductase subunit beta [Abditibacteriaceae bacterium]
MPPKEYKTEAKPIWCPGCGDFAVLAALYQAFSALDIDPTKTVIVSGIGCSSRLPVFVKSYGFHTVHGRTLPVATGIKLANPDLTVLAMGGDGDAFAIGGGHIPHAARRNVDITYIVMDNFIYGLTKGQTSPTTGTENGMGHGFKLTATNPHGQYEDPLNPLAMLLTYGASFVARGYSAKPKQLAEVYQAAMRHKGFSFIQVLSPCVVFNRTYDELDAAIVPLEGQHDTSDLRAAMNLALDTQTEHLGIFYQVEKPTLEDRLDVIREKNTESRAADLGKILAKYK